MHADHRLNAQIIGDDSSITWKEALDRYRFPVVLTTFTDAADYPWVVRSDARSGRSDPDHGLRDSIP